MKMDLIQLKGSEVSVPEFHGALLLSRTGD
jgi:hypothetical protein